MAATWILVVGSILGSLTLVFLMAMVTLSIFGFVVPCSSRFLVTSVLAFGAALSAAFIGGHAGARGALPIPGLVDKPLAISVGGGVAVLIIMFALLNTTYSQDACSGP